MKNVRTAIAANGSLPAFPLPKHGETRNISVVSALASTTTLGSDTQLIQIHPDCAIYFAITDSTDGTGLGADANDMDLPAGAYATYAVKPGSTIAVRAVTGAGNVKIQEA